MRGGLLLAAYALGMALPLFLLALLWDRFDLGRRAWLRGRGLTVGRLRLHTNSLVSGLVFIAIGVLFLVYDGTASMSALPGVASLEDLAYRIQQPLAGLGEWSDLLVLGAAAVALLGLAAVRAQRNRRARRDGGGRVGVNGDGGDGEAAPAGTRGGEADR